MGRRSVIAAVGVMVALATAAAAWAASAPPSGPDPAVEEWPEWPYDTTCQYGLQFDPVTAFSGRAEAEKGTRPSEEALRNYLASGDLPWLRSTRNWRRVAEDETRAEFSRGRLTGELEWLSFQQEEGGWKFSGWSSDCEPTSVVGNGPVVTWSLAKPAPPPDVAVRRIRVTLGSGLCSDGRPLNPRARLVFRNWDRKLLMTIWQRPFSDSRPCKRKKVSEPPLKVTLTRRIKLHRLWDGSTYPPTPAIEPTR